MKLLNKLLSITGLTSIFYALSLVEGKSALAHVKWVIETESIPLGDKPELFTGLNFTNVSLSIVALIVLGILLLSVPKANKAYFVNNLKNYLCKGKKYAPVVLSMALGTILVISALRETILAPELALADAGFSIMVYLQLLLGIMLILGLFTRIAALGTLIVFGLGYSIFQGMILDYLEIVGVSIYLLIKGRELYALDKVLGLKISLDMFSKHQHLAMPVMRIFAGVTLFWLGIDKWIRPEWGLAIIKEYNLFTFGFSPEMFVFGAGLVEAAVGLAVIIGLYTRLISVVVVGLFLTTAVIFGIDELVGHLVLIGVMYSFLTEGSGGLQLEEFLFKKPVF